MNYTGREDAVKNYFFLLSRIFLAMCLVGFSIESLYLTTTAAPMKRADIRRTWHYLGCEGQCRACYNGFQATICQHRRGIFLRVALAPIFPRNFVRHKSAPLTLPDIRGYLTPGGIPPCSLRRPQRRHAALPGGCATRSLSLPYCP